MISALDYYILSALSDERVAISQIRENCKARWNMTDNEIETVQKWLDIRITELKSKEQND
jgi:hypothetical protein